MFWLIFMKLLKAYAICVLFAPGVQAKQLESRSVTAVKGGSAVLRCSPSNKDLRLVLVEWEKFTNRTKLGVYHVSSKNTSLNNKRIKLEVNGQHSTITIKDILMSDKGWYYCIFHTFPDGKLEDQIYLDVKESGITRKRNLSIFLPVTIGAVAIMVAALVIWKLRKHCTVSDGSSSVRHTNV